MKRRLTKLVVFLLLGSIVNVAVAWGCVLAHPNFIQQNVVPLSHSLLARELRLNNPSDIALASELESRSFGCLRIFSETDWPHDDSADNGWQLNAGVCIIEAGWPYRVFDGQGRYIDAEHTYLHAFRWPPREITYVGRDFLPVRPLWPGLLANVIFYAAMLWLLTLGLVTARRVIRHRRGLCINCGYDLRNDFSAGCPECGWRREGLDEPKG